VEILSEENRDAGRGPIRELEGLLAELQSRTDRRKKRASGPL